MTAIDPSIHSEVHPEGPQHAEPTAVPDTFLDYAARTYEYLAKTPPPMPMDVDIAATIGLGYEVRRLADAIERLEQLLADPTAVLRAAQAEAGAKARFPLEEAESAIEQLPVPEST